MLFDDRLATVLRQDGSSDAAKRTQFRQLLDILGNRKFSPSGRDSHSLIAAAWLRLDALGRSLPKDARVTMIRELSWRFRSADLAAHLSDFEPEVASAALNRAQLSEDDWCALIPRLPVRARGFLRLRKDLPPKALALLERLGVHDRGLPLPTASEAEAQLIDDAPPPPTATASATGHLDTTVDDDNRVESAPFETLPHRAFVPPQTPPQTPPPTRDPRGHDPIETGRSEISALVERIAQFRRTREAGDPHPLNDSERSPRLPLDESESLNPKVAHGFGFSADAAGRIDWAEADVAPMVIGARLVSPQALGEYARLAELERAFVQRQPIIGTRAELSGAPRIAGEWTVDAQPRFTPEGHFKGYVGRFRRVPDSQTGQDEGAAREADRIRQLLHELRTPVTAIQGYAEVIQQQLFGPTLHEYRAIAAAIAADAAHVLAGFEELDRLARLEIGALSMEPGESDLPSLLRQTEAQLAQVLSPRLASLKIAITKEHGFVVALDAAETELLVWRLMATLAGACGSGETLIAKLDSHGGKARLRCNLPQKLSMEEDVFAAEVEARETAINSGVFGAGFALRLAQAEARASGGNLWRDRDDLILALPLVDQLEDEPVLTRV